MSDLRAFRSIGFNHPHGNLNAARSKTPCCILLSTRDRDVFVKTVFSAFQRLDSVPLEIGARTVSLVCQEMFTTRGYFLLEVVSTGLRYLIVSIEEGSGAGSNCEGRFRRNRCGLRLRARSSTAASNVEMTSCEKRSVACNLNADPPLIVFFRDNE